MRQRAARHHPPDGYGNREEWLTKHVRQPETHVGWVELPER